MQVTPTNASGLTSTQSSPVNAECWAPGSLVLRGSTCISVKSTLASYHPQSDKNLRSAFTLARAARLKDTGRHARLGSSSLGVAGKPAFSFFPYSFLLGDFYIFIFQFNASLRFTQPFIILTAFPIDPWDFFQPNNLFTWIPCVGTASSSMQSTLTSQSTCNPELQPTRTREAAFLRQVPGPTGRG